MEIAILRRQRRSRCERIVTPRLYGDCDFQAAASKPLLTSGWCARRGGLNLTAAVQISLPALILWAVPGRGCACRGRVEKVSSGRVDVGVKFCSQFVRVRAAAI